MKINLLPFLLMFGVALPTLDAASFEPRQQVIRRMAQPRVNQGTVDLKAVRTTPIPDAIVPLVADLADPSWAIREAATARLRTMTFQDEALMRILDQWSLTQEQRQRILNIIDYRITSRKRGALGIRMTPNNVDGIVGIVVTDLIDGLPARRVLEIDDVIRRIDGVEIRSNEDLIKHVQQLPPGRRIEVEVLRSLDEEAPDPEDPADLVLSDSGRRFQVVQVEFALGSYDKLGDDPRVSNPETNRRRQQVRRIRERWSVPVDPVTPYEPGTDARP